MLLHAKPRAVNELSCAGPRRRRKLAKPLQCRERFCIAAPVRMRLAVHLAVAPSYLLGFLIGRTIEDHEPRFRSIGSGKRRDALCTCSMAWFPLAAAAPTCGDGSGRLERLLRPYGRLVDWVEAQRRGLEDARGDRGRRL